MSATTIGFRHVRNVVERRGLGYFEYLVTGVAMPRLAYRYLWGPSANALVRRAFERAVARLTPEAVPRLDHEARLDAVMDSLHRAGITGFRHMLDGGGMRFRRHARRGVAFAAERNADRCAFNARFGASLLTESSARALLRRTAARVTNGYKDYAPIDFGGGLTLGRFVTTDSGTGRWHFFNHRIVAPLVRGRRVVDLGCNNGSMPLMMLRAGARSVVGVEGSPEIAELARANGQIFSWRDIQPYDLRIFTGDMRCFLTEDLGPVDVVTAFCSLYYLPRPDMARVIGKASAAGATLVLQANDSITNLPASAAELKAIMEANGFPAVTVHHYPGFGRPLLVGRASR